MNRSVGKTLALLATIMASLWASVAVAELSATVDRREIAMGETLRLTLLGDAGEQPAEIDLSPLSRDWEILSRSSATNARYINGQNQVTRSLEMELAPLREGTLSIPSLSHSGRSTTPVAIRVNPEPIVAPGDALVLFEASVDEASVYVQAETILTVTLQQAINLDGGEISVFDIPGATVEDLERRSFQRRVGNRTWLVTELRYAVYPQKSGTLTIPAIGFTAREVQPGRSLLGARLGRRLRMASSPIELQVKSVPDDFPGEVWLPARELNLTEKWSLDPESLEVGDSTTRTLTLIAKGLQGSQLPPLSSIQGTMNIPELRFYPDQESIEQSELADGLQGQRIQSEALVARSGGNWTLPEIRIPWWNTETDTLQFAVLPARSVSVNALSIPGTEAPTVVTDSAPSSTAVLPVWIWILSGSGWLIALALAVLLWTRHRAGHTGPSNSVPSGPAAADLRQALVAVRRNLETGDVAALRRAVLDWASLHHDRHFGSLSALARVSSDELARQLQSLDRSLYGVDEAAGSYQGLIETLRNEPSLRTSDSGSSTLALYPT